MSSPTRADTPSRGEGMKKMFSIRAVPGLSETNTLIGDVMQKIEQSNNRIASQSSVGSIGRKSFASGSLNSSFKSVTPVFGHSTTMIQRQESSNSNWSATPSPKKAQRNLTLKDMSDMQSQKSADFFAMNPFTGQFGSDKQEGEYRQYRAKMDAKGFRLFIAILCFFTTGVCLWNVIDGGKKNEQRALGMQLINVICSICLMITPESILLSPGLFIALYFLASSGALASRMVLDERVGVIAFALFEMIHYTASILFAHFRECLILTAIQTPIFIAAILLLGTKDRHRVEDENEYMYSLLVLLAEVVFLIIARQTGKRSRRTYIMVVFIAKENQQKEKILHREELFDDAVDDDDDESSEEENNFDRRGELDGNSSIRQSLSGFSTDGGSDPNSKRASRRSRRKSVRRRQTKTGFSRDVFIHSEDVDIMEEVGRGSFGVVYKAVWHDTVVCVKHLTAATNLANEEAFFKEFAAEAKIMSNLRHPNIVMFMGVVIEADFVGLVTEFCFEGNVSDVLVKPENQAHLQGPLINRMIMDTCRGMSFLHLHKPPIIHRDLKGQNILVDDNWHCKVADFGLSQLEKEFIPDDSIVNRQQGGTVLWAAPELLTSEQEVATEASDVYSFGVVLFEFLYRETPYQSVDSKSIVYMVSQGKRPDMYASQKAQASILRLDQGLVPLLKLMKRCWSEDPRDRPTFHDILTKLEEESQAYREEYKFDVNATMRKGGKKDRRASISSNVDKGKFHLDAKEITIGKRLGTGTFGQVFEGSYFGTPVAVKELFSNKLSDELIVEFHQECNLFKDMRHPNIVLFMGSAFDPPKLYMVMELCEYGSVMNLYTQIERPDEGVRYGKALDLANDICQGGSYLHTHNPPIIHRDLKSENVLVDGNFVAKITDFGQSRFNSKEKTMTACGSPLWTAPEVIRGEKYSEKADVFSFAIILYELLTWSLPYPKDNPHFVMMKVASEDYRMEIEDEWDPFFKDLVVKCWHPKPEQRPSFKMIVDMIDKCHRETSLMKLKGDWRDTLKTFRMKTLRKQKSIKKEKLDSEKGAPENAEDEIARLFAKSAKRRGSLEGADQVSKSSMGNKVRRPSGRKKSIALRAAEASEFYHTGVMPSKSNILKKIEQQLALKGEDNV